MEMNLELTEEQKTSLTEKFKAMLSEAEGVNKVTSKMRQRFVTETENDNEDHIIKSKPNGTIRRILGSIIGFTK